MTDSIRHPGPDADGHYFWPNAAPSDANVRPSTATNLKVSGVALGHRRLSIIDVTGSAQPLGNEDNRIQIVFNGEIYNYAELRVQLINAGHKFRTEGDTEVIVHLYEQYGLDFVTHLRGMFAGLIVDRLFIAWSTFSPRLIRLVDILYRLAICVCVRLFVRAEIQFFVNDRRSANRCMQL